MSVTVRPYVNGGWEVDIKVQLPDGAVIRKRKKAAGASKQPAQKWPRLESVCCSFTANRRDQRRTLRRYRRSKNSTCDSLTDTQRRIGSSQAV